MLAATESRRHYDTDYADVLRRDGEDVLIALRTDLAEDYELITVQEAHRRLDEPGIEVGIWWHQLYDRLMNGGVR